MAKNKPPTAHGRKPPPPIRNGNTRSTFDGCAVTALALAGGIVAAVGGAVWGVVEVLS